MSSPDTITIPEDLDARIAALIDELKSVAGDSDEYTKTVGNLVKLMQLRNDIHKTENERTKLENDKIKIGFDHAVECDKIELEQNKFNADQVKERSWKPSPDAIVGAAATVVGILLVLHHEKANVIASKALGFVNKMR